MSTPARLRVPVNDDDHVQGAPDASVTLLEYGDYQCPHCGQAHAIVKALQRQFKNDLRFVYRHFPLTESHPLAEPAAETAEYASAHGVFWEMHNALYDNQEELSIDLLVRLTDELGMEPEELASELQLGKYTERVERDVESGEQAGVHGTPTFFINGVQHVGSFAFEELADAIQREMDQKRKKAS